MSDGSKTAATGRWVVTAGWRRATAWRGEAQPVICGLWRPGSSDGSGSGDVSGAALRSSMRAGVATNEK